MGLFGGSDTSSAQGQSSASINSSGWVVGRGNASGGKLATAQGFQLPAAGWLSVFAVAGAFFYYKQKRGK